MVGGARTACTRIFSVATDPRVPSSFSGRFRCSWLRESLTRSLPPTRSLGVGKGRPAGRITQRAPHSARAIDQQRQSSAPARGRRGSASSARTRRGRRTSRGEAADGRLFGARPSVGAPRWRAKRPTNRRAAERARARKRGGRGHAGGVGAVRGARLARLSPALLALGRWSDAGFACTRCRLQASSPAGVVASVAFVARLACRFRICWTPARASPAARNLHLGYCTSWRFLVTVCLAVLSNIFQTFLNISNNI